MARHEHESLYVKCDDESVDETKRYGSPCPGVLTAIWKSSGSNIRSRGHHLADQCRTRCDVMRSELRAYSETSCSESTPERFRWRVAVEIFSSSMGELRALLWSWTAPAGLLANIQVVNLHNRRRKQSSAIVHAR